MTTPAQTNQATASIVRQIGAVCGIVAAALTQSVSAIHMPASFSITLGSISGLLLAVEHYVGDPSTGTTPTPPAATETVSSSELAALRAAATGNVTTKSTGWQGVPTIPAVPVPPPPA